MQCESRPRAWPRFRMEAESARRSTPGSSTISSATSPLCFQCGRTGPDDFISDHDDSAMSGLQAFAVALAVLGWRARYLWM